MLLKYLNKKSGILVFNLICLFICLIFLACNQVKNREDFLQYINNPENGLIKTITTPKANISCRYHPIDLFFDEHVKLSSVQEEKKDYEKKIYFDLFITTPQGEMISTQKSETDYYRIKDIFDRELINYIKLINSQGDTISPIDCIFSSDYGTGKYNEFLLVFERKIPSNCKYVTLNLDASFMEEKLLSFKFNISDIYKTPQILK